MGGMKPMSAPPVAFLSLFLAACGDAEAKPPRPQEQEPAGISQEELERITAQVRTQIEALRGEAFPDAVRVEVTDAEGLRGYVLQRLEALSSEEEVAAEEQAAKLLGLLPDDYDYLEGLLDLVESQAAGFYDPPSKTFYLMEAATGGMARIVLAHELTHALDDQLYDLDDEFSARRDNSDALWAYHAVVEGSGTLIMEDWTRAHAASLERSDLEQASTMGLEELGRSPSYVWKPLIGVYTQGSALLRRGPADLDLAQGVRRAFDAPPRSSEQVLHPEKYWDPDRLDEPLPVALHAERLPAGWDLVLQDTLGELGLALLVEPLGRRGGVTDALTLTRAPLTSRAAAGWGGDRFVLLAQGASQILALATVWDTEGDAEEFELTLKDLIGHLERDGRLTRLERAGTWVRLAVAQGAGTALLDASPAWLGQP